MRMHLAQYQVRCTKAPSGQSQAIAPILNISKLGTRTWQNGNVRNAQKGRRVQAPSHRTASKPVLGGGVSPRAVRPSFVV